jgi:uncharacterized protein (TIGR04255 family)
VAALRKQLSRAPAREAVIDIRFERQVALDDIDRFVDRVLPQFELKHDLFEATIGFGPNGDAETSNKAIVGRRLDNQQTHYVVQCHARGFTVSRLSPYGNWSEFRDQARRWWDDFVQSAGAQTINRIAVRYVNEIKIPRSMKDFDEYLTCPPQVPEDLPQEVSGFLTRVIVPDVKNRCVSVVTQALEQSFIDETGTVTVLLDIDVFRQCSIPSSGEAEVWAGLDELRDQKNRVFFAHITEKSVEMFL